MAHAQSNSKSVLGNVFVGGDGELNPSTFHDFLGNKRQGQVAPPPEVSVSMPVSATSDLGSERHVRSYLEGIAVYGMRNNTAMAASSSNFIGNKRSNSNSLTISAGQGDSQDRDSPFLTKLLRYSGHEEDTIFPKPSPRSDAKWGRAAALSSPGPLFHNPQSGAPFCYANRMKDASNASISFLSQTAADEGSRTGIKRQRLADSMNAAAPGAIPGNARHPPGKQPVACEPEATTNLSEHGRESSGGSGQMTVFYRGQAHVFDNVPPNKADVIMALAGSSGGRWSTVYQQQKPPTDGKTKEPPGGTSSKQGIGNPDGVM